MAPGEEVWLENQLGRGEVTARLDALGPSEIRETAVAAVWLVIHRNADEEVVGKFIEVTRCPAILQSQTEDMHHGLRRLQQRLGELDLDLGSNTHSAKSYDSPHSSESNSG
jgi:hydrogenase-1 operon protein HyaF